jgi:hypothetical protein
MGVQPDARHQHEMAVHAPAVADQAAHRDALRAALFQTAGDALQQISLPSFISMASTLAVPAGRMASGTRLCTMPFGHFVDGAVAARRDNQVRAAGDVLARDLPAVPGPVVGQRAKRCAITSACTTFSTSPRSATPNTTR